MRLSRNQGIQLQVGSTPASDDALTKKPLTFISGTQQHLLSWRDLLHIMAEHVKLLLRF